jgi:hypothetical protein
MKPYPKHMTYKKDGKGTVISGNKIWYSHNVRGEPRSKNKNIVINLKYNLKDFFK